MIEVAGSRYRGAAAFVRQAVAYAAVTGQAVRVSNARARWPKPGLRSQHARASEAMRELVGGSLDGVTVGSRTFLFRPGTFAPEGSYIFDIGTAGSATALALAVLPLLACRGRGVQVEIRGGTFQDFAPSVFHLQHVLLPAIARMGANATLDLVRPGYLPAGSGVIRLTVAPAPSGLSPLVLDSAGRIRSIWASRSRRIFRNGMSRRAWLTQPVLCSPPQDTTRTSRNAMT